MRELGDARIGYLRHEDNRGGSAARNTGLAAARGSLIAFQDSDDTWLPHKLERQVAALLGAGERTGVVYCPYRRDLPDGGSETHPADPARAPQGKIHRALLRANFIGTPTIVARRTCFESVGGFDEKLQRFQDWDWMVRASREWDVGFVDEPLVLAGFPGDNISGGHTAALVQAERRLLDKHEAWLREAGDDVLAYRLWHLAHVSIMQGSSGAGWSHLIRAQRTSFRWSRAALALLAAFPPLYRATYRLTRGARFAHRGG